MVTIIVAIKDNPSSVITHHKRISPKLTKCLDHIQQKYCHWNTCGNKNTKLLPSETFVIHSTFVVYYWDAVFPTFYMPRTLIIDPKILDRNFP